MLGFRLRGGSGALARLVTFPELGTGGCGDLREEAHEGGALKHNHATDSRILKSTHGQVSYVKQ